MISGVEILDGLKQLAEAKLPTYYSPEAKQRATELAEIAGNCVHYLDGFYENKVQNRLLVLNEEDWTKRHRFPYGLIAGIQNYLWYPTARIDNPVFKDMEPYYENCPGNLHHKLCQLLEYQDSPYLYALLRWWEVLMVHEYTHNYNRENGVAIKLKWFNELFCDYFTYAYLKRYAEISPLDVPLFELLSEIMYVGGMEVVKYRSLEDFEELYTNVGAANYCWYHGWFNVGVMDLYRMYGENLIEKVISLYQSESGFDSSSERLVARLDREMDGYQNWYDEWMQQKSES
jgi:hypothetical protein